MLHEWNAITGLGFISFVGLFLWLMLRDSPTPKYCGNCGRALRNERYQSGFSEYTGKPETHKFLSCPASSEGSMQMTYDYGSGVEIRQCRNFVRK